jgi:hypothetical protein
MTTAPVIERIEEESGITLVETLIGMLVITIGALGMASVFLQGMQAVTSSPNELVATQKAAEAVESVFAARDSHTLAWDQLRNVADGGIFLGGERNVTVAGADGIVNTSDDGAVETVVLPGHDQTLDTPDDRVESLQGFTREIIIHDVSPVLRSLTVQIGYPSGTTRRTYTLTTYISSFA